MCEGFTLPDMLIFAKTATARNLKVQPGLLLQDETKDNIKNILQTEIIIASNWKKNNG